MAIHSEFSHQKYQSLYNDFPSCDLLGPVVALLGHGDPQIHRLGVVLWSTDIPKLLETGRRHVKTMGKHGNILEKHGKTGENIGKSLNNMEKQEKTWEHLGKTWKNKRKHGNILENKHIRKEKTLQILWEKNGKGMKFWKEENIWEVLRG